MDYFNIVLDIQIAIFIDSNHSGLLGEDIGSTVYSIVKVF